MSLPVAREHNPSRRFPRVSGDEPALQGAQAAIEEFSPRERG